MVQPSVHRLQVIKAYGKLVCLILGHSKIETCKMLPKARRLPLNLKFDSFCLVYCIYILKLAMQLAFKFIKV